MTKFQVGDKVVIKLNLGRAGATCCYGVNGEMLAMRGQVATIKMAAKEEINPNTTGRYRLEEDSYKWAWSDDCFESLQPEIKDVDFDISELL